MSTPPLPDLARLDTTLGFELQRASRDEVVIAWTVDHRHLQPAGIVHGGVYCAAIESACSIGATLDALDRFGRHAVGLENHTSFVRATRSGRLTVTATPITRGRNTQLWSAVVTDQAGTTVATGRVRLFCVEGTVGGTG